jgi:hypothetical protein
MGGFEAMAWAENYLGTWNRREADCFPDFFALEVAYSDVALGETFVGIPAVKDFQHALARRYPDVAWRPTEVVVESPDRFAVLWTTSRTVNGVLKSADGISVADRHDRLIVRNWNFLDCS